MDDDDYNTEQNLIDILYIFFQYNQMKKKWESNYDKIFWIGYNIYSVINYSKFLYKRVRKKFNYLIYYIDLHDTTPDPYLYSILFKDQTIIKKLQKKIPWVFKDYKEYLDVNIFENIRQDLIYFYDNYEEIKKRDDLRYEHITDGYKFLISTLPPHDTSTTFIDFLKGKDQSTQPKSTRSRNSRTSNVTWKSVGSKSLKKSKTKPKTLYNTLSQLMRKTRKKLNKKLNKKFNQTLYSINYNGRKE
jgi:hypothetical protein